MGCCCPKDNGAAVPLLRASSECAPLPAAESASTSNPSTMRKKAAAASETQDSKTNSADVVDIKIPELSSLSRALLSNVAGFLESRDALDATAERVLPHKWMELHPSFVESAEMAQKNRSGERARTLDEVLEVASLAKPLFDNIMRDIVARCKLPPDEEVKVNNKLVMLDHNIAFKVLSLAPLKGKVRCIEKTTKENNGDFSKLVDVVRCSVVVYTEEQLEVVAQALSMSSSSSPPPPANRPFKVVRLKNRFKDRLFNGYRDALYNILVNCGEGVSHVCEVQLHLAEVVALKETSHVFYEYFRTYFSGSGSEKQLMAAMEDIRGYGRNVDSMLYTIIRGQDMMQLLALETLVGPLLIGDVRLQEHVSQRLMELSKNVAFKEGHCEVLYRNGRLEEAEPLCREVLQVRRAEFAKFGEENVFVQTAVTNLGVVLLARGKFEEAEVLLCEALSVRRKNWGNANEETLLSVNNLAQLLKQQGKLAEAEPLYREGLEGRKKLSGEAHPETIIVLNNLAVLLQAQGKAQESESLLREALAASRKKMGDVHPNTLTAISNLAVLLEHRGKAGEAEPLFKEALAGSRQQLGRAHPTTLLFIRNLAAMLKEEGKFAEAEPLYRELLTQQDPGGIDSLTEISALAEVLRAQRKLTEAESLYRKMVSACRQLGGDAHPDVIYNLAEILQEQGKSEEAKQLFQKALISKSNMARQLRAQGDVAEAEVLYREAMLGCKKHWGDASPETLPAINNLAMLLQDQSKFTEAVSLHREVLAVARQQMGHHHPRTRHIIQNLAMVLEILQNFAEAEQLYRELLLQGQDEDEEHELAQSNLERLLQRQQEAAAK